jgi:hypothetical protein
MLLHRLLPIASAAAAARAAGAASCLRGAHFDAAQPATRELNLCNAVNDALHVAMESEDRCVLRV